MPASCPSRPQPVATPECDRAVELANCITHGVGLALALAAGASLVAWAALRGTPWQVTGVAIYGVSLVGLYAVSTLYHLPACRWKHTLRIADHACIYVLIAGTYTPFTLTVLRGPLGWTLFTLAWTAAVLGVVFKIILSNRFHAFGTAIYIAMGWMAVMAAGPIMRTVPMPILGWLFLGGVLYTAGVAFFVSQRFRFAHAIWHLFVMGGSLCHFVAVTLVAA